MHPLSLHQASLNKLKDLNPLIDHETVVVGDFNTPLSTIDRSSKQKINKEILKLKGIIDLMGLTCL
jgi:hypothetical protein